MESWLLARSRSGIRWLLALLLSPFGYAKELVLFAGVIATAIGTISGLQDWWNKVEIQSGSRRRSLA
ncbi:MAG: hypothetical protein ACKVT0_08775 [Planctomycetaceae bacterium]